MSASTEGIFSGHALWLVPESPSSLSDAIREEMGKLREANPNVSSGEFGIHATLLAGLGDRATTTEGLRAVTQEAVDSWRERGGLKEGSGLKIEFQDVTTRGSYFQCILIALQKHPSLLLLNTITRTLVNSHFPPRPSSPPTSPLDYFPHISLLYASISASQAQFQIDLMRKQGTFSHPQNNPNTILFKHFDHINFVAVDVYDCTGKPQDWIKLHSIPL